MSEARSDKIEKARIRINTVVQGEIAEFLIGLKRRGRIMSYTDGVIQALKLLEREDSSSRLASTLVDLMKRDR